VNIKFPYLLDSFFTSAALLVVRSEGLYPSSATVLPVIPNENTLLLLLSVR
jgi:hypothetical protein